MLNEVEGGTNPVTLLQAVVGAIVELRERAHLMTDLPGNRQEEGESGAGQMNKERAEENGDGRWSGEVEEGKGARR